MMIIMLGNQKFESIFDDKKHEAVREELDRLVNFILKNEVGERLKEDSFIDENKPGFTRDDVQVDKETVAAIKARIEENADHLDPEVRREQIRIKKRAEALEVVINDQIELNDWFGPDVFLVRLAEYDDWVNGVDLVVEFDLGQGKDRKAERFAIALDASFSTEGGVLERKIKRNLGKVLGTRNRHGEVTKPAEVKYFESEIEDESGNRYKGKLEAIVPVVVGIDSRHCNQIMGLFADILKLKEISRKTTDDAKRKEISKRTKEKISKIAEHPAQLVFVEEIIVQLQMYLRLLAETTSERQELYKEKTKTLLKIFREIALEKENISKDAIRQDRVFSKIKEITEGQRTPRSFNPA